MRLTDSRFRVFICVCRCSNKSFWSASDDFIKRSRLQSTQDGTLVNKYNRQNKQTSVLFLAVKISHHRICILLKTMTVCVPERTGTRKLAAISKNVSAIWYFFLGQSVQEKLMNQSESFEDRALNVDTNKTHNLELLLNAHNFVLFSSRWET